MSSNADNPIIIDDDPEYDSLIALLKKSHKDVSNHQLQQDALQQSMDYIHNHPDDLHLFCNKKLYNASVHCLILFSFQDDDNQALVWFQGKLTESLNGCTKCMSLFQRGRVKLKQLFSQERAVPYESVELFSGMILTWEAGRLLIRLQEYHAVYSTQKAKDPSTQIPNELLYGVAECLYGPGMLRLNSELRSLFDKIFYSLLVLDHPLIQKISTVSPGLIYLLFEGQEVQRKYALKMFSLLSSTTTLLDSTKVIPEVLEEFEIHFIAIQNPKEFSDQKCQIFYRNIYPVLRLYDSDAIINKFNEPSDLKSISASKDFEVQPLFKVIQSHVMGYLNEPLPYVLRFFAFILTRTGEKYWSQVAPFTFQNVLETLTASPHYLRNFIFLEDIATMKGELDPNARLDDLFSWISPFICSLDISKQQMTQNKLTLYFITQVESQNSIPLSTKSVLFRKACELSSSALTLPSRLYSSTLRGDLLLRSDSRVVVTKRLVRFMDYATTKAIFFPENERVKNSQVSKAAIEVICKAMRFDVLKFAQGSYDAHNGLKASSLKFSPELFQLLLKQNFATQLELAFQILCSLENVSSIISSESPQKNEIAEFLGYLRQFFVRFSDIDAKNTKMILSNANSLKGYWACVFSSDESVYQSAVDILYETFDAEGRLEGVHALLMNNIEACVTAINDNLTSLIFLKSYYPCPRGVLVLTDVVQALNSPVNGIFGYVDTFSEATKAALCVFWNRCWSFLELIYSGTIKWAEVHRDLVEFTRDTLDLSHSLFDCFKNMKDLQGDFKETFSQITNTFPKMLFWLRLNDASLLASCVKLISATIDLAIDLNLDFDKSVITLIAKYASRAKGFTNKLTSQQAQEILNRAKSFDKDLVDEVVQEAEAYRKSKEVRSTPKPSPIPENDVTAVKTVSKPKGQLKITNFGSLSKVAPSAPSQKKVFPKSALELAREEIKSRVVHPPGPLGFNSNRKRPAKKQVESSDDEDDEGSIHSLFNLAPKPTTQLLYENKPRKKQTVNSKREEEYSRLRLNVDLRPLYRKILAWSYQREDDYPDSELQNPVTVADKFSSPDEYIKTYEPLLLLECWQAIMSAKSRQTETPIMITVGSKSTVGDFFEVFFSISKTALTEKNLNDSDLVVLALCENEETRPTVRDVKNSKISCFGKIHEIKHARGDRADVTVRITRSANLNNAISPLSNIMIMKVMQMTTIEREFSSLHGLRYYNLADEILKAQPDTPPEVPADEVKLIQDTYQVNESQAKAIGSCINTVGFSLIQGPPGTGKTKTILGIIGYMLSGFRASNAISIPEGQAINPMGATIPKTRKVLVCAPSNAAVDELVLRLKDGIMNSKGAKYHPKIVRLGRTDAINTAVKDMTLEELVDRELGKTDMPANNMDALHQQLKEVKAKIMICQAKLSDEKNNDLEAARNEKRALTNEANGIKKKMDDEKERQNSIYRVRELNRRNVQAKILNESEIICSTLSGSAHDMVASIGIKFDSVIIDEACQCTELSAIIPLRYGCNRCIMVGDPNQLPPTVLSSVAAESLYDQSLFVRMAKNKKPLLLNVQYRMNSMISRFPSKKFYDGELKDGPDNDKLTERPWHKDELLSPYRFFDIVEGQQIQNSKTFSYTNKVEVDIAMELISKLFTEFPRFDFKNRIGVITPYKEQNRLLQQQFVRRFGKSIKNDISFNTIDGFQGQEKDIIIISCVRADPHSKGVGFLRDFRRMNVALTRPKCSLWILGNHDSLVKDSLWFELIDDAKERGLLTEATAGFTRANYNKFKTRAPEPRPNPTVSSRVVNFSQPSDPKFSDSVIINSTPSVPPSSSGSIPDSRAGAQSTTNGIKRPAAEETAQTDYSGSTGIGGNATYSEPEGKQRKHIKFNDSKAAAQSNTNGIKRPAAEETAQTDYSGSTGIGGNATYSETEGKQRKHIKFNDLKKRKVEESGKIHTDSEQNTTVSETGSQRGSTAPLNSEYLPVKTGSGYLPSNRASSAPAPAEQSLNHNSSATTIVNSGVLPKQNEIPRPTSTQNLVPNPSSSTTSQRPIPRGPSAFKEGSDTTSGSSGQVASRSGTLPPIPAGPRNFQRKRRPHGSSIFIERKRRPKY